MNTAAIFIKTDPKLKVSAQKIAEAMGLSLTSVINKYLKHFVAKKTITFNEREEIPNAYTIKRLKESEADIKAGRKISFANGKDAVAYVRQMAKNERRATK